MFIIKEIEYDVNSAAESSGCALEREIDGRVF